MAGPLDLLLDDAGRGIEIHVGRPLPEANQRLMDTLGVRVRVVTVNTVAGTVRCNVGGCEWSYEGTAEECSIAGEAHRAEEHSWIRPSRSVTATGGTDALAALDAGVTQRELLDAQEALETHDCLTLSCDREAEPDSDYCRVCLAGSRLHARTVPVGPPELGVRVVDCPDPDPPPAPPAEPEEEPVTTPVGWSRDTIIEAIRKHNTDHGRPPSSSEWAAAEDGHPSAGQVARAFGTWAEGIEAAGFPRPTRGGHQGRGAAGPAAASGIRTAAEDAVRPSEPEPADDGHWYRAWVDALPIDTAALRHEQEMLEKDIGEARLRITVIERILGVLSEELVEPE